MPFTPLPLDSVALILAHPAYGLTMVKPITQLLSGIPTGIEPRLYAKHLPILNQGTINDDQILTSRYSGVA
jgi:hypothetical protein